jgi:hypothetical protein
LHGHRKSACNCNPPAFLLKADLRGQPSVTRIPLFSINYTITVDEYAGHVEIEIAGTFYHPDFGYITLSTPEPFVLHDGDEWPESGTLIVTGANDSKAKLIAIDHLTCTVEVDSDGDGIYEWQSDIKNWEDL